MICPTSFKKLRFFSPRDFCAWVCVCVCAVTPDLSLIIWGIMGIWVFTCHEKRRPNQSVCLSQLQPQFQRRTVEWNLTGPDMSHTQILTHTHTQVLNHALFIKCVSCDLTPPRHTDKYTPTQTHRVYTCVCIVVRTEKFALPDWWSPRLSEQQKGFVEVD